MTIENARAAIKDYDASKTRLEIATELRDTISNAKKYADVTIPISKLLKLVGGPAVIVLLEKTMKKLTYTMNTYENEMNWQEQ